MTKSSLGTLLEKYRQKSKLNHTELAELLGVKRGFYSQVEGGAKGIALDKFMKLVGILEIPPDELYATYGLEIPDENSTNTGHKFYLSGNYTEEEVSELLEALNRTVQFYNYNRAVNKMGKSENNQLLSVVDKMSRKGKKQAEENQQNTRDEEEFDNSNNDKNNSDKNGKLGKVK